MDGRARGDSAAAPAMGCPLMPAMMRGPAAALRASDALGLTADQRSRLEEVRQRLDSQRRATMSSMRPLHARLSEIAAAPTVDEARARAALTAMGQLHAEMAMAMLHAARDAGAILTPTQRDSLAARAQHAMRMGGGMGASSGRMNGATMGGEISGMSGMDGMCMMSMPDSARPMRAMPRGAGMGRPGAGGP
jgi:Spy/CpxP family protein refolding chaperone